MFGFVMLSVVTLVIVALGVILVLNNFPSDAFVNGIMFPCDSLDTLVERSLPFIELDRRGITSVLSPEVNAMYETVAHKVTPGTPVDTIVCFSHGNAGNIKMLWGNICDRIVEAVPGSNAVGFTFDYTRGDDGRRPSPESSVNQCKQVIRHALDTFPSAVNLIIYGRSIGGAVSIHALAHLLQSDREVTTRFHNVHLVLETPFIGTYQTKFPAVNIVAERFGCVIQLQEINRHKVTMTCFMASRDEIINNEAAHEILADIIRDNKLNIMYFDTNHNGVVSNPMWTSDMKSLY